MKKEHYLLFELTMKEIAQINFILTFPLIFFGFSKSELLLFSVLVNYSFKE